MIAKHKSVPVRIPDDHPGQSRVLEAGLVGGGGGVCYVMYFV